MPQFITNNGMWLTFDEIVSDLEVRISLADKRALAQESESNLSMMHHSFGTWIRNSYGLWAGNPLCDDWVNDPSTHVIQNVNGTDIDCSPHHPDQVSMDIIKELWTRVQYLKRP
jgi:hypothetical protein